MYTNKNTSVRINIFYQEVWGSYGRDTLLDDMPLESNKSPSSHEFVMPVATKQAIKDWYEADARLAKRAPEDLDYEMAMEYPPDGTLYSAYDKYGKAGMPLDSMSAVNDMPMEWDSTERFGGTIEYAEEYRDPRLRSLDDPSEQNYSTRSIDHIMPSEMGDSDLLHRVESISTLEASQITSQRLSEAFTRSATWDIQMDFPTEWGWGRDPVTLHRESNGNVSIFFPDGRSYVVDSTGKDQIWEIRFIQTLSGTPMLRRLLLMGNVNFDQFCRDIGCMSPYTSKETQDRFMNIALRTLGILSGKDIKSMPIDFSLGRPTDVGIKEYMTDMRRESWRSWLKLAGVMREDNSLDPMKLTEAIRDLQSGRWETTSA